MPQVMENEICESRAWYAPRRKHTTLHGWTVAKRGDARFHAGIVYRHYDEHPWKDILVRRRVEKLSFRNLVLEMKFQALAREWKRESRFASTPQQMFLLPSYQKIVGLGPDAIPLILRDLTRESNHWFWALASISGENPVEPVNAGNVQAMRQAWIDWGMQRGFL